jgi:hypothetical protein
MLRLSIIPQTGSFIVKLEGKLLAPWCEELVRACDGAGESVQLDLYDVSYVDAAGMETIRALMARGVALGRCSSFVAELLKPERAI